MFDNLNGSATSATSSIEKLKKTAETLAESAKKAGGDFQLHPAFSEYVYVTSWGNMRDRIKAIADAASDFFTEGDTTTLSHKLAVMSKKCGEFTAVAADFSKKNSDAPTAMAGNLNHALATLQSLDSDIQLFFQIARATPLPLFHGSHSNGLASSQNGHTNGIRKSQTGAKTTLP